MADEEILDYQQELSDLKEEYAKLQEHLTNVEIRYQTELTESNQQRHNDFAVRLQDVVVNLFGRSQFSDLKVLLENGSDLSVHKLVLLARSEDWGVPDLDEVDILDLRGIKYEVAYGMMKWVYTDEMDVEEEDDYLVELLKTATKYKLEALHIRCQNMMISIVNLDNANKFYIAATESSAELLKDHCMEFLSKHQVEEDETSDESEKESMSEDELIDIPIIKCDEMPVMDDDVDDNNDDDDNEALQLSKKVKKQIFKSGGYPFVCEYCRKSFHEIGDIEMHTKIHEGKSKAHYECYNCNAKNLYLKQVRSCVMKTGGRRTVCRICLEHDCVAIQMDRIFKNIPYECGFCGRLLQCKSHLTDHIRSHTGDKPIKCEICNQVFSVSSSLSRHRRCHTGDKPFKCEVCGRGFATGAHCRRHARIHSGEKPYQCNECGRFFSQSNTLVAHLRTHTGERPHSCEICSKSFSDRRSLQKHNKRIHDDIL